MARFVPWLAVAMLVARAILPSAEAFAQDDDAQATITALQTQVADLQAGKTPVSDKETPTPAIKGGAEGEKTAETSLLVNVEMIVDVSGSMAQVLDTGETRMDAAKRVLSDVIAAIPERKGVSVGLRIYGHEGDNTEAGKEASCASSELVAPVKGVNKDELNNEIEALQPTGWTPIALSLQRAAKDFPKANENVTNAIVLVTDGLETCGGDPAKAAATLRSGSTKVSTNVIGFALTGDEQQTLASIAEQGKGKLLGAANADELSTALFSVLTALKIVAGPGFVGGNAFSLLPAGESGEVSVIAVGTLDQIGNLPFVVRNNTAEDVEDIKVTVTARDGGGNLVGAADALSVNPHLVLAGTVAFGAAYFGNVTLPPDATFDLKVASTPAGSNRFSIFRDLSVTEASLFEDRIVGQLENSSESPIKGPLLLSTVCFDLDGTLVGLVNGTASTTSVAPGESQPFQIALTLLTYQGGTCPAFLVAGSGIKG